MLLAGFDGFSVNINNNNYDPNMRFPVNEEQTNSRNSYYKDLITNMKDEGMKITFIIPSKYE